MPKDQRSETIVLLVAGEALEKLHYDISQSVERGAETVMLLTTNNPQAQKDMKAALSLFEMGNADAASYAMPNPDVVVYSTIWTIGMAADVDTVLTLVGEWTEGGEKSADNGD